MATVAAPSTVVASPDQHGQKIFAQSVEQQPFSPMDDSAPTVTSEQSPSQQSPPEQSQSHSQPQPQSQPHSPSSPPPSASQSLPQSTSTSPSTSTSHPRSHTPATSSIRPQSPPSADVQSLVNPTFMNPVSFDLGHLLIYDPNPLSRSTTPAELNTRARDCAQALINQLLHSCERTTVKEDSAVSPATQHTTMIRLPLPTTPIPREKPVPPPPKLRPKTRWEQYAQRKGIQPKPRDQRMNKEWDQERSEWLPKWGHNGKASREKRSAWIQELDPDSDTKTSKSSKPTPSSRPHKKLNPTQSSRPHKKHKPTPSSRKH